MTATVAPPRHPAPSLRLVNPETAGDKQAGVSHEERDEATYLSASEFGVFAREYAPRLLAVARRILHSREDAADAVQDAFLAAYSSRGTFHGDSTVYTWLYRIVVNVCLMAIRSRRRAKSVSLYELLQRFDRHRFHIQPAFSSAAHAADRLEYDETRAQLRACIDRLPEDYRTILLLRDIDGLDTDEAAALLHLSRSAVKTRLHRARQALRALLETEWS